MLELQENIAKVQSATVSQRRKSVDSAVREYFAGVDSIGRPGAADFAAASDRTNALLRRELLSTDFVTLVNGGDALDDTTVAMIALAFETTARPVRIPGPVAVPEARAFTLALAAAGGAAVGMLLLAPLLRLTYDMRDLGLVVGGPLGALLFVLLVHHLGRLRFLTRLLPWLFVRSKPFRGATRSEHEKAVRAAVEQWVDWAVTLLAVLCFHRLAPQEARTDSDKALRRIGKLVYGLHQASADALPVVAHELIQEAKNAGFENMEGPPLFLEGGRARKETMVWKPDLQGKYETFGHITEGDQVTIERPAVIFGGRVVQRGLVRRVRDRA